MKYDIIRAPEILQLDKDNIICRLNNHLLKKEDFDDPYIFRELLNLHKDIEDCFKNYIPEKVLAIKFIRKFEGLKLICDKLSLNLKDLSSMFCTHLEILINIYIDGLYIDYHLTRLQLIKDLCCEAQKISRVILDSINLENIDNDLLKCLKESPFIQKAIVDRERELNKIDLDQGEYTDKASTNILEDNKLFERINRIFILRVERSNALKKVNNDLIKHIPLQSIESQKTQLYNFTNEILKPLIRSKKFGEQNFSLRTCNINGYIKIIKGNDINLAYKNAVCFIKLLIPEINFDSWVDNKELIDLFFNSPVVLRALKEVKLEDLNKVKQNILNALRNSSANKKGSSEHKKVDSNNERSDCEDENASSRDENDSSNKKIEKKNKLLLFPSKKMVLFTIAVFATFGMCILFRKNFMNFNFEDSKHLSDNVKPEITPGFKNFAKNALSIKS